LNLYKNRKEEVNCKLIEISLKVGIVAADNYDEFYNVK
jgi:hypothetical protein